MLGTGLDLPTLAARRRTSPWYRPDDVLRILPGLDRAMVRLASGALAEGTIGTLIALGNLSFARTGAAYAQRKDGAWTAFASNAPRITDAGMTIEPSATNHVKNNAMTGYSGTVGSIGWIGGLSGSGLTQTLMGVGIEDGIDFIDIRVSGTAAGTIASVLYFDTVGINNVVNADTVAGKTWTIGAFARRIGGSFANVAGLDLVIRENDSGGAFLRQTLGSVLGATSGQLGRQPFSQAATLGTSCHGIACGLRLGANSGAAIDFTLRLGWPQVGLGSVAMTPIRTTGAAATRAADDFRCPTSGLSLPASGTLVAEFVPGVSLDAIHAGEAYALGIDDAGSTRLALRAHGTAKGPRLVVGDGEGVATVGPATGVAAGGACRAVATFGAAAAGDNRLSVNGIFAGASERRCVFDLPAAIGLGQVHNGGAAFMSGVAREWAIRSTVLTADDSNAESARYTA